MEGSEVKAIFGIMLTLLSVSMLILMFNVPSRALSLYMVHNIDTGLNYATIQEAINAPETLDGHTIKADRGTYHEHVFVNKSVQIKGVNREFNFLDGNGEPGTVVTITADDVMVAGFTIMNSGNQPADAGIRVESSRGTIIVSNSLVNTYIGILVVNSDNNTLDSNRMENCEYGDIELRNSDNNMVKGNSMGKHGIRLWECNSNTLRRNKVFGAEYGVSLKGNHNNITGNTFENSLIGIDLQGNRNIVARNIARSNIQYGIKISGNDNAIYHNNFFNNIEQVWTDSVNSWSDSYPSGGNYWSDHSSVDLYSGPDQDILGSDGISDSPYVIDAYNRDRYPLMMWPPPLIVVSFSPPINNVASDETFAVDIMVANIPISETPPRSNGLYAWSINITFDPVILNVTNITEGPFLQQVYPTVPLPVRINNTAGYAFAGAIFWVPLPPEGASGSGVLATVDFVVKEKGVSDIAFGAVKLSTAISNNHVPMEPPDFSVFTANGIVTVVGSPLVSAVLDMVPKTLNLRSKGKWITAYIELPEDYNVGDINASTILLNDEVPAESSKVCGTKLMVRFDRSEVIALLPQIGEAELTITGTLFDGTPFEGSDTIIVK